MIEKNYDQLTAEEVKTNWQLVEEAIRAEVRSFHDLETFERTPRKDMENICSSRWVLRWKLKDEKRTVKARLTIRGFEDLQMDLQTFAGTATRWGQRLISSMSAQNNWPIWAWDVSTAFLQGLTFEQLAEMNQI